MSKKSLGLLPRVIIAIILGVTAGFVAPLIVVKIFATINGIFSNFLSFCIPLVIMGLTISGIADLGEGAGKLLLITVALAYISTILSGFFTYFSAGVFFPYILNSAGASAAAVDDPSKSLIGPIFTVGMPPVFDVTTALLLAFILGIGISSIGGVTLKSGVEEFKKITEKIIAYALIPFLPLYVFGIFLNMSYTGEAFEVISVFGKIIVFILVLSVFLLLAQFGIAGLIARANPLKMLYTMIPAYITALGTSSSAATIPVTLEQVKKVGVKEDIADFCVPLCATIHMAGSAMKITGMAMAILWTHGQAITIQSFGSFILMLGITMVAAPAVPGGAIMAVLGILKSILGFSPENIALMIAVYVAIDSFGTACNVTGDGAISVIVNRFAGNRLNGNNGDNNNNDVRVHGNDK